MIFHVRYHLVNVRTAERGEPGVCVCVRGTVALPVFFRVECLIDRIIKHDEHLKHIPWNIAAVYLFYLVIYNY